MSDNNTPWPQVLAIGDALMDTQYWVGHIPAPGEDAQILQREENTGGSAANTAMGLAWLGTSCAFYGCIGPDADGASIESMFQRVGVDTRLLQRQGSTGYVLSMIDPTGERTMFSYRGAAACTGFTPQLEEAIAHARVVLLSGYMLADEQQAAFALQVARKAQSAGALVALDTSPKFGDIPDEIREESLELCDIFLPNLSELAMAGPGSWEENLGQLAARIPCIAVKLGGDGSRLHAAHGFWPKGRQGAFVSLKAPTKRVVPLDTTGAGDAFNAGFLAAYLQGRQPAEWLEAGNWLAGKVIATRGATGLYKTEPPPQAGRWG